MGKIFKPRVALAGWPSGTLKPLPTLIGEAGVALWTPAVAWLVVLGFILFISASVVLEWWAVAFGMLGLCVFVCLAAQGRPSTLMTAYVFFSVILACLHSSIWNLANPHLYGALGLVRYAMVGLVACWGLLVLRGKKSQLKGFDFAWVLLLSIVFISMFYSVDHSLSVGRGLILASLFFSLFALRCTLEGDSRGPLRIVNALLLASACCFVPGFVLLFKNPDLVQAGDRFHGIFGSASASGAIACMALPLALWGFRHHSDLRARPFCGALMLVLAVSLALTQTRNAIGAFLIGMCGVYLLKKKRALFLLLPVAVLVAMIGVSAILPLIPVVQDTDFYTKYVERQGSMVTASGRIFLWQQSRRIFMERPIVGHGFGTGGVVLLKEADLPPMLWDQSDEVSAYSDALPLLNLSKTEGLNAHNSIIEICLELGLVGLVACVYLLGCVTWELAHINLRTMPPPCNTLAPYLGGSFIAGLVSQSFEACLFSAGSVICTFFWFVVAAILCLKTPVPAGSKALPHISHAE